MNDDKNLFYQCFNLNPIPAAITTIGDGVIVDVNDAFCELSGYAREELVGRTVIDAGLWVDMEQREEVLREGRSTGVVKNREARFRHASGSVHDCLLFTKVFEYESAPHFLSMAIDITERKRSEDALSTAESRYRAMVENNLSGVAIFRAIGDGEDFEYVEFNRAAERIDAVRRDEVLGRTVMEAFPGSRDSGLFQALQRAWRTGEGEYLPVYYYRDERISGWRESFVYKLPSGELVEVYSDHTAHIRTAEDLSERNRELFTLTSNLPGMVYRCRNDRDWTMEAVSQGCLALTGYGPDDLVANRTISYGAVIHPEDRDRVWDEVQAALSRREHFQLMYRIVSSGGRVKWVWEQGTGVFSSDGRLLSLEGFVIDISEQKRIRDELRLSEDKFSKIFQASPDWISITTLDEGIFLDVNDGYLNSSGYTRDEVIGRTSLEINVWENPGVRERIVGKIREQGPLSNEEVRFRTKSGEMRSILWSAVPITFGTTECILGLGRDITNYKFLEEELARTQKMEAVGRLAGTIAHDFNNYLSAIEGFCELVLLKIGDPGSVARSIGKIRDVKTSASALIRQLLSFSRKQPAKPVPVDLNEVVTAMKELLVPVMGNKIDLDLGLDGEKCLVLADRSQLEQVIMNLSLNARDAMPRGGTFRIVTEHVFVDEGYAGMHVDLKTGPYVRVSVSDSGMGMNGHTVSHVFDPYFTTKTGGKGTGLGLTIAYNIVRLFQGCIMLHSEPGRGSTFTIFLPEYRGEAGA